MPAPDIQVIKDWCRISDDAFDGILPGLIATATVLAGHETGHDYTTEAMPAPVQTWVAAQCAYWIDQPAAATERAMVKSTFLDGLLDPYRTYA